MGIASIKIQNFKSIREADIELTKLNILIGANGAGKSNFIGFFKFLNKLFEQNLQLYINQNGRADDFLYFGLKKSNFLAGSIAFDNKWQNQYVFMMIPDALGNLIFKEEQSNLIHPELLKQNFSPINSSGTFESGLKNDDGPRNKFLREHLTNLKIFHFHDTGFNSEMKRTSSTTDYSYFREDGSNIAAFLYRLQEANPQNFKLIERTIQSAAPFFDKFKLQPDEINPQQIFLKWYEKGSNKEFGAHNLSDGTLRFICLATLLLQPELPEIIIIDEPELGLHPSAISTLADMLKIASDKTQVIVSTQSVNLVDEFSADDIIVVDRKDGQSVFTRQSEEKLKHWLNDYSLGELWEKNVLGGRPK